MRAPCTVGALVVLAARFLTAAHALPPPPSQAPVRVPPSSPAEEPGDAKLWLAPHDVQGNSWLSPYEGETVDVRGLVTAVSPYGFWLQSVEWDDDDATSEGLYVYAPQTVTPSPGDLVTLSALVAEYSPLQQPGALNASGLHLTELVRPSRLTVLSSGHAVEPVVLGVDRTPPGERVFKKDQFALDEGEDVERAQQQGGRVGPLDVKAQGLAFWESLEGMLVTLPLARAVSRTSYQGMWVVGEAFATHSNSRGGVTLGKYADGGEEGEGGWDVNPEAILVYKPLDGSHLPSEIVVGSQLSNITGVVSYANGWPVLLPLTAPTVLGQPGASYLPSGLKGDGACLLTLANYNVENLHPRARTLPALAAHVVHFLNLPDLVALEEVQDNSGPRDDGTTAADQTFKALIGAIEKLSGGVTYGWVDIAPVDGADGGQPGGNIRPGFLYRTDRLALDTSAGRRGRNDEPQRLVRDERTGETTFALNPGLIDPLHPAWHDARKPLSASFLVKGAVGEKKRLHAVAAHFSSKRGSGALMGRIQAARNGGVEARIAQAEVVDRFVSSMLEHDPEAHIVLLGDLNEFTHVQPLEVLGRSLVELLLEDPTERYSFHFDANAQQIDHIFVAPSLVADAEVEILHLNTWGTKREEASDHDPVLARVRVC